MNKSLSKLIKALNEFIDPTSQEWDDTLDITIPEGLLRYKSISDSPYPRWRNLEVNLIQGTKSLSFVVNVLRDSDIVSAVIVPEEENKRGERTLYTIKDNLTLSVADARSLYFHLQQTSCTLKIMVPTKY